MAVGGVRASRYQFVALAVLAVLATAAAACSSGSSGPSSSDVEAMLVTPGEVGEGFTEMTYDGSGSDDPNLCGTERADEAVEPEVKVGMRAEGQSGEVAFMEEIRTYASAEDATKAFDVGSAGFDCATGELHGDDGNVFEVTIGEPLDIEGEYEGIDQATAWDISLGTDVGQAVAVAARKGSSIITLQFVASTSADTSAMSSPADITGTALDKVEPG